MNNQNWSNGYILIGFYFVCLKICTLQNAMEAAEKEGVEIRHYELQKEKEKEKENSSSLSSPQMSDRHGWWHLALASGCGLVSEASEHII